MVNNLIGFASDGAASNVGRHNGVVKFLRDWAKNPIFAIHCMAHRLELAVQHAFNSITSLENMNKISEYLDKVIKKTYSFYNGQGFKRKDHLKNTCEKLNKKFYALSGIIDIRWVASDYKAMKSMHQMWKPLVQDLDEIKNDRTGFELKTIESAKKIRPKLIGKFFLIMFHFIFDILNELSFASLNMQKRESLIINIHSFKSSLDNIFTYLLTQNGKYLELFLSEAKCESTFDPEIFESCRTVDNYVKSNQIVYQGVTLLDDKAEIPDVAHYRAELINALLLQLNAYFPDGHLDNFDVFDPKNMPEQDNYVAIRTYGIEQLF